MKRLCFVLAVLLAGCGGGGGGASAPAPEPVPPPVPPMPGDAFTAALVVLVRSAPDSTEPADVEGSMPTMPDGDEPLAVE